MIFISNKIKSHTFFSALIAMAGAMGSLPVVAENEAPAGQMCPEGAYVIGFDLQSNIICSEIEAEPEVPVPEPTVTPDKPASTTQQDTAVPKPVAAQPAQRVIVPVARNPVISDVDPAAVVFGTPEVSLTVTGTGFEKESIIVFDGSTYPASVNQAGTQIVITIATRRLSIGPYAITVLNGSGGKVTLRKALEVY